MRYLPAPGLHVLNPGAGAVIGEDGVEVGPHDLDLYRMVMAGDLVEAPAPKAPPASGSVAAVKGADL